MAPGGQARVEVAYELCRTGGDGGAAGDGQDGGHGPSFWEPVVPERTGTPDGSGWKCGVRRRSWPSPRLFRGTSRGSTGLRGNSPGVPNRARGLGHAESGTPNSRSESGIRSRDAGARSWRTRSPRRVRGRGEFGRKKETRGGSERGDQAAERQEALETRARSTWRRRVRSSRMFMPSIVTAAADDRQEEGDRVSYSGPSPFAPDGRRPLYGWGIRRAFRTRANGMDPGTTAR